MKPVVWVYIAGVVACVDAYGECSHADVLSDTTSDRPDLHPARERQS